MLLYNFFPENDAAGGFLIFLTIANENDFQERFIVVSRILTINISTRNISQG